jgi:hypothetical protein
MRQTCETDRPDCVAGLFADFALRSVDDRLTFLDPHLPFRKPDLARVAAAMNDAIFPASEPVTIPPPASIGSEAAPDAD